MLDIDLETALLLCEIKTFEKPYFSNESSVILFHFDGTKKNLAVYLHLILETDHIIILNPLNRTQFTSNFHKNISYEFTFGLDRFFKSRNLKNINVI